MTPNFEDFKRALEYLVSIEPDPETCDDYDEATAPFAQQIDQAHSTIRAYGEAIAPNGLGFMQEKLYELLNEQTSLMAESVMRCSVNMLWDGIGGWRG